MYKYLGKCRTAEELKQTYQKLAKQLHPDNGGSNEEMALLNSEYKDLWKRLKDVHFSTKENKIYEETDNAKKTTETPEEFINIVANLASLNVEVEMCGSWLWIFGNTYPVKDDLSALGCRWSKGKKRWYYTHEPYRKTRKTLSMNDIRFRYGSTVLDTEQFKHKQLA